ncbi:hypothetical protein B0H17DRAFT_1289410 [Mycena rosella]|uniref:Uncharacterized protein n=1 Tax=Mycena rosella TaxID=1033263 RepID=A0AAD7BKP3_MYCRO|nr:hypothetical protein B0H17DRAFT_1289410 [Mycena rosella]
MTVAIYEGDNAEENWREAISRHSNFRHPNIIQLFGTARSSKIHAAIFYDGCKGLYVSGSWIQTVRENSTLWIRPSTRTLCVELAPNYDMMVLARSFNKYRLQVPKHSAVTLGAVNCLSGPNYEDSIEVAFSPDFQPRDSGWNTGGTGITLENHWIRYARIREAWLSQANHIFKTLKTTSNHEEYAIADQLDYEMELTRSADIVPAGYLFLCPLKEFQSDGPNRSEEAENLGFPSIKLKMVVYLEAWDARVYEGLRRFHEGKGFDPYSQEIARHMEYPLFQLSERLEASFAHGENI